MRDITDEVTRAAVVPDKLKEFEWMMKKNRAVKLKGGEGHGKRLGKGSARRKDADSGG